MRASGIPEQRTAGFWNNVGRCCGSAGVASFFLAQHRRDASGAELAFARRVIDDMLSRATTVEIPDGGTGLAWIQAKHRVRPELLAAKAGFMLGVAGIGLTLLEPDAIERGRPPLDLPD